MRQWVLVRIGCLFFCLLPAVASALVPTAAPKVADSEPSEEATPTPTSGAEFQLLASHVQPGAAVAVNAMLPSGTYDICVVPNGSYSIGGVYSGPTLACESASVLRYSLDGFPIWDAAREGSYDVLVLEAVGQIIITGSELGGAPGLLVSRQVGVMGGAWWSWGLLGALLLQSSRRSLKKASTRSRATAVGWPA